MTNFKDDIVESWPANYRAQAIGKDGLLRRYTLRARVYPGLGARSPFEYTIVPEELTVRTQDAPSYTQQKFSSFSEEMEREERKAEYAEKKLDVNKCLFGFDVL